MGGDNPQAYLPGDRRRALAEGRTIASRCDGAVLFADISGFTPLTEALAAELGTRRGAEELTVALDEIFGALIEELGRHGGDVIYFSGDAITAWLDGDDGIRAIACGLAMQRVMAAVGVRTAPTGREFRLGLKVAVAAGEARRFVVGDPDAQLIDVLAGALMDRVAAVGDLAGTGEVLVDTNLAGRLAGRAVLAADGGRPAVRVVSGLSAPVAITDTAEPPPDLPEETVRRWILPDVYRRMRSGSGEFLTELRPCVPLFLRFGGIDYDGAPNSGAVLDEFVVAAQRIVADNGGSVLQLTVGDKGAYLYAVFGAPIAHENDAARACASALALLRLGDTCAVTGLQVGLASGALRTGTYGHPQRRTYACLGDATNLAARLMSAAAPGSALGAAEVMRSAGPGFRWGEPQALSVKGKAAGVVAAPLLARHRSRYGTRMPEHPLLGRETELASLTGLAESAIAGRGAVALLSGAQGTGKTRLLMELSRWMLDHGMQVGSGAPRAYGAATGYGVWRDICQVAWRIPAGADASSTAARLDEVLRAVDPRLVPRLPLLGPLLGVSLPDSALTATFEAKLRKSSLESLMLDLVSDAARSRPLGLVIDAGDHLDELSWDLVVALGRAAQRLPLLVVVAARGAGLAESGPLSVLGQLRTVALAPFDAATSRAFVTARLGDGLDEATLTRIIELAEGNAFHLEEMVNHLRRTEAASGGVARAGEAGLPDSLHALQLARIDALAEPRRNTLKVASVVGVRFELPTVAGACPELGSAAEVVEHADALVQSALVAREEDSLVEFAFRNATTQRVAYESMTFAGRSEMHDRVLGWLEVNTDAASAVDLLAYHARHGTDPVRKRDHLLRAGVAAQDRYANDAAADYYLAALPLVAEAERPSVYRRLGKVLELRGRWPEAHAGYEQAIALCTASGDELGRAHARTDLAEVERKQGHFDAAGRLLALADETFVAAGDRAGRAEVLHLRGTLASQQADYDAARTAYRASLEIRSELGDDGKIGALLSNLAVVAEQEGDYEAARSLNEQALAVRESVGDPWATSISHNNLGMIALLQHDYARADLHIEASMRLATQVGDRWVAAVGEHNRGIARRGLRRFADSAEAFGAALQTYLDYDDDWSLALLLEDVVFLAVDTAQDDRSLRLLGAADAVRDRLAAPRPPATADLLVGALAPVRDRLGDGAASELNAGRELDRDGAVMLLREACDTAANSG
jgi:predicted ATPase/class 3 adenylate cyclase